MRRILCDVHKVNQKNQKGDEEIMKSKIKKLVSGITLLGVITCCFAGCGEKHSYSSLIYEEEATCTEEGCKAYYYCFDCDVVFDENKKEVTKDSIVIPALGHDFDDEHVCKNCDLDVGKVVTSISELTSVDKLTLSSLSGISETLAEYDALDDDAKEAVQSLVPDMDKLSELSEQVSGIEIGVKAKYLYDAGQNQTLTGVKWTEDVDPVYGSYKMIEYDSWQWANVAYSSSTLPTNKKVVMFVYNASSEDVELTWGAVDPSTTGCIYNDGIGWKNGAEDPDVGHQVMKAQSWNTIIMDWNAVYGFNAKIFVCGHYAGSSTSMSGWKFSDVYMMDADQLPLMEQIIANSTSAQ